MQTEDEDIFPRRNTSHKQSNRNVVSKVIAIAHGETPKEIVILSETVRTEINLNYDVYKVERI
ncbi:hypothetical protein KSF78_0000023 [Schistosoma japonicum]|nr:hypothetical protein KSF78_0000023 [Schistosoma japonicum]